MSEETEMDLQSAISDDMANISQAMRSHTPLQLAEAARHARDPKVSGIRDWVIAGRPITKKQLWVLAEHYVYHAEAEAEEAMDDYGQTVWDDYDLG